MSMSAPNNEQKRHSATPAGAPAAPCAPEAPNASAVPGTPEAPNPVWNLNDEGFVLRKPLRHRPWYNYLANGDYGLKLSHLGDGYASTLREPRVVVSNYDFFTPNRGRFLYIKEGDKTWNPGLYPTGRAGSAYRCVHAPGYSIIEGEEDHIRVESRHFLPPEGSYEIWSIRVENLDSRPRRVAVYSLAEMLLYDSMAIDPVYFSWFTNSRFRSDNWQMEFFRTDRNPVFGFAKSLMRPFSWEMSLAEFCGDGDHQDPEALRAAQLGMHVSAGDPSIAAFHYQLDLAAGESREWSIFLGQGEAAASDCASRFPDQQRVNEWFQKNKDEWRGRLQRTEWDEIAEPRLRAYAKTFLPYQIYQQSTGMVRSAFRGYRDVAQDAMGLSNFEPAKAAGLIRDLCRYMTPEGRCLRQWNTSGVRHDHRDFRDLPLWLPLAVDRILQQNDSREFLLEQLPYFTGEGDHAGEGTVEQKGSIWEHMLKGLDYVLRYGPHDLLLMGAGDWNDALSGLGPEGESLWLNEIAFMSLGLIERMAARHDLPLNLDCKAHRDRLYNGVMRGWNGSWFLRGWTDSGRPVGDGDRIFLLPQAWFVISGMADRAPDRAGRALDAMVQRLGNENGLLICHPGFDSYEPDVGNLSCLAPGVAENFAVYNHASAFGIYALLASGRNEEARLFLDRLLPFNRNEAVSRSEPFVLVNYYNGGYYPHKSGQGGIPWLTGTVHWLLMALLDHAIPGGLYKNPENAEVDV